MEASVNVAITGSDGYIATVLYKELVAQKYNVICCDRSSHEDVIAHSFDNQQFIDRVVVNNCDTIFHLAANSEVGPSATKPLLYYHNNTSRTINMVNQLARRGWKGRIVFSSTAAVYGDQNNIVTEDSPLQPCSHYGHSKLMCEQILNVAHLYNIDVTVFRYFNVAGAYDEVGQPIDQTHIVTRICNAAAGREPLVIYGDDYPTVDGTCIRDYIHVRDVCLAQIFAMTNKINGTFNLGSLQGTTVKQLISEFVVHNQVPVSFLVGKRRKGDPAFLVADPRKFIERGFTYQYSQIDTIVKSAWRYYNGF